MAEGLSVRAFVHYDSRPSLGNLEYLPREVADTLEVISGDIQDPFFVRRAVEGCEIVFHLAALIGIPYSYTAPEAYVRTNTCGTLNVLEACRNAQTPRLVHTSTSETYGTAQYVPIDEKHPADPENFYGFTKLEIERLLSWYGPGRCPWLP